MAKYENIEVVPQIAGFGGLIGKCGPKESGRLHYLFFGLGCLAMAIACFIAPYTFLPPQKADHETPMKVITALAGCLFVGLTFLLIFMPLLVKPQVVFLFENGLVDRKGNSDRQVPLSDIGKMKIHEWYEHRLADRELNIQLKIAGQKDIRFGSALKGDADRMIEYLQSKVENTEIVPFQP